MRKAIMVLALLCCIGQAAAYEIRENPDRKISFGLNYGRTGTTSEWTFGSFKIQDFTKETQNLFLADVKIPVSSILTFQLRGGYLNSSNDIFTGEKVTSNGYDFGVGVRFYLP